MTRVVHILSSFARGGTATSAALLARAQRAAGADVSVVALGDGPARGEFTAQGIESSCVPARWAFDVVAIWRLRAQWSERSPDVLHCWGPRAAVFAHAARIVSARNIVTLRGGEAMPVGWMARLFRRSLLNAAAVVTDDPESRFAQAARGWGLSVQLVEPGIPPAPAAEATREALWRRLELPQAARLLLAAGPIERSKRHHDLVWAADIVKCICDDFVVVIVGSGPRLWRLRRYRDGVEIADRVRLPGDVGDRSSLLAHADIFLSASPADGVSLAVLEAMAAGLPVVAAESPGHRRLVLPGVTGQLVEPGYRPGFAGWMDRLLTDPARGRAMGEAGRERANQEFPLARMVAGYDDVYRQAASRPCKS